MSTLFVSERIFSENAFVNGGIVVNADGIIEDLLPTNAAVKLWLNAQTVSVEVHDYGQFILMPGLIDTHVHINEPGRTEWEGYETATKAAAAGGFTTIVDMPLNSNPPTTTVENLLTKQRATNGKIYVDVGFWGGVIPGNERQLIPMLERGVVGFKCFLCPSGVDEFPSVSEHDVDLAYNALKGSNALIAFHAEICGESDLSNSLFLGDANPTEYETYLKTRPASLELNAIDFIARIAVKYDNIRTHIVHLSTAEALPTIRQLREQIGERLSVETCHHYLTLASEDVPNGRVDYKCCPPIRDRYNREQLWKAIKSHDINLVVSDHSPCTPEMKLLTDGPDRGNFLKSWGGISSVQFGLSLFYTNCLKRGLGITEMYRFMCQQPARLCGFDDRKGRIARGFDADFCIWDPKSDFVVTPECVHFRNKANPYMGKILNGVVHATIVRGQIAYDRKREGNKFSAVGGLVKRKQ